MDGEGSGEYSGTRRTPLSPADTGLPPAPASAGGEPHRCSDRRAFAIVIVLLAIAAGWARVDAQQGPRIPKIGLLTPNTPAGSAHLVEAFKQGMRDAGYVEGKSFALEVRFGEGQPERLPALVRELVSLKPDVLAAASDPAIAAARRETRTIPIVMVFSTDPVGTGFVASLARPGGNVTGLSGIASEISAKRLALLKEAVPGLSRVALLWNPDVRGAVLEYKETEAAARSGWSSNPSRCPASRISIARSKP